MFLRRALLALAATQAAAQTWSDCNPMNSSDCKANPALGTQHFYNFANSTAGDTWNATSGAVNYGQTGGAFTINHKGDSPTIKTKFYIFWGEVHVTMKAAPGKGVVSSIVLQSDDLDEVDWEFLGGNNTHVETNYFGKGNTTSYDRAVYYPVETPIDTFHTYSVHWNQDTIQWAIDGTNVRTLAYANANGGHNYPQTPMDVRLGIWAGGDESNNNGTIEWAGGLVDYSEAPFTMTVQDVTVKDHTQGKEYSYGDRSGSWQSIKVAAGNSTAQDTLNKKPALTISQQWAALDSKVKAGIVAAVLGFAAILVALFGVYFFAKRREGKREAAAEAREYNKDNVELIQQQQRGLYSEDKTPMVTTNQNPFNDSQTSLPLSRGSEQAFNNNSVSYAAHPRPSAYATQMYPPTSRNNTYGGFDFGGYGQDGAPAPGQGSYTRRY